MTAIVAAMALAGAASAHAASPFQALSGSWSGSGRVTFENGQSERLRCNARYRSGPGGSRLDLTIRCASPASSFELAGNLAYNAGRVSGSWQERTLGASGSASGRASDSRVELRFSGTTSGSMSVALASGRSHTVTVATSGGGLRGLNVSLRRN
jgi:hypothetical protein